MRDGGDLAAFHFKLELGLSPKKKKVKTGYERGGQLDSAGKWGIGGVSTVCVRVVALCLLLGEIIGRLTGSIFFLTS